jgi:hypothetical protein
MSDQEAGRRCAQPEHWLPIEGFEGLYEVSDLGRIRSKRRDGWKVLVGGRNPDGYPIFGLCRSGRRTCVKLHRVVCRAFNGPPPQPGLEAAHLDGNRANARATNLVWATHAENMAHKILHGTAVKGEAHPLAKLTADKVRAIVSDPRVAHEVAAAYGISRHTVSDIRRGIRWQHLGLVGRAQRQSSLFGEAA